MNFSKQIVFKEILTYYIMQKNKIKLAIVVELSGRMEALSTEVWKELERSLSVNFISSRSPWPHIPLAHGFTANNNDVKTEFINFFNTVKPFIISGLGVGVFAAETPVVHVRWELSREFIRLKKNIDKMLYHASNKGLISNYNSDINWVAKTTLAYGDTSYKKLFEILDLIRIKKFTYPMLISKCFLYEYSESDGEKNIMCLPFS